MKIVFDLDGVLRDLVRYITEINFLPYPKEWDQTYGKETIMDLIRKSPIALLAAKPTVFLPFVQKYYKKNNFEIWTNQPIEWIDSTLQWIEEYLPGIRVFILTPQQKETRLKLYKNIILVEDYPKFKSYKKILLIDQPYNKKVNTTRRVSNIEELECSISKFLKKD